MPDKRVVLLLSGGLDSGSLLFWALRQGWQVLPLFVDYGQTTRQGEWRSVKALLDVAGLPPPELVQVPAVGQLGSGTLAMSTCELNEYFPSRNLLLLVLAAMYAFRRGDASDILIGLIADAAAVLPDCSEEFVQKAQGVLQVEYPELSVRAPFLEHSKLEIVREAMTYGLRPELTFSCNRLPNHHCWSCSSCIDRLRVLSDLGVVDNC